MSKKNTNLALISPEDISKKINMEIDKNDIVTYQVAKMKEKLEKEEKTLMSDLEKAEKRQSDLQKAFNDTLQKNSNIRTKQHTVVENINKSLKQLGCKKDEFFKIEFKGICEDEKSGKRGMMYVVNSSAMYYDDKIKIGPLPIPQAVKNAEKKVDAASDVVNDVLNKLSEVRTKLANVNKMERRAKAKMTEENLKRSELGEALLLPETKV